MRSIIIILLLSCTISLQAQLIPNPEINPNLLKKHWEAEWISHPVGSSTEYGVFLFRNKVRFNETPDEFIIHISADNRYRLYVNNKWIGLGPARCDADNWIFDTYNLADYLVSGENQIAICVWNYGEYKSWSQISLGSGLIVQGENEKSSSLNTPGNWKSFKADAYTPVEAGSKELGTFIIVGPGDHIDGQEFPWNWKNAGFEDSHWSEPRSILSGAPKGVGTDIRHALVPRTIPAMELKTLDSPKVREYGNLTERNEQASLNELDLLEKDHKIHGGITIRMLLDQETLVTAYPELKVSGGAGSKIKVSYAESLFDSDGKKPHRDSIFGMHFKGIHDIYEPDGGENRIFSPLWFRSFRYIQLEITTAEDPLTIHGLTPIFTAYPFEEKAYFESDENAVLDPIWDIAWRTSRLCANELFYDCPYYEQMQYLGDTRVQSLISLYMAGDDRLMKKAINDFYNSINPEGLTQSRYPTEPRQIIPTFSLFWVSMIHDYMWHADDIMFASKYLVSIQKVLQWFETRINPETGMLGGLEYWPFVDWTKEWPWDNTLRMGGVPPGAQDGNSSIISLQYAMTLEQAADIFAYYGLNKLSDSYATQARRLRESTKEQCWNKEKGLYADTPEMNSYSQHANTLAILSEAIPKTEQALFMENILRDTSLIQGSLYFKFYIHRAAIKAGLGNKYLGYLKPWSAMVSHGLSTFPEIPDVENTRSDCHAWSSSPLFELLATVAGIQPAAVGFRSVIIEPHPNGLQWFKAGMPHKQGEITLDLKFDKKGGVSGDISLPGELSGIFVWDNQIMDLQPGKQKVSMKSMDSKFGL